MLVVGSASLAISFGCSNLVAVINICLLACQAADMSLMLAQ